MIDLPPVAPPNLTPALAPGVVTPGGTSFGEALGALLGAGEAAAPALRSLADRRGLADDGKILPDAWNNDAGLAPAPAWTCALLPSAPIVPPPEVAGSAPSGAKSGAQSPRMAVPPATARAADTAATMTETTSPGDDEAGPADAAPQATPDTLPDAGPAVPPPALPAPNVPMVADAHTVVPDASTFPRALLPAGAGADAASTGPPAMPVAAANIDDSDAAPSAALDPRPVFAAIEAVPVARRSQPAPVGAVAAFAEVPQPGVPAASADVPIAPQEAAKVATGSAAAPHVEVPAALAAATVPQSARTVFAAALAAAANWRERSVRSVPPEPAAAPNVPIETFAGRAVEPAAAREPVDLGSERGLRQTIDRIATLRDDLHAESDSRETRIRLAPERLGGVDISVRREGDAIRVHFTAEREATQALLIDAQPRLTELAAQRGLRLVEASVSQHDASPQQRQQPRSARFAADAAPARAETPDITEDTRLA